VDLAMNLTLLPPADRNIIKLVGGALDSLGSLAWIYLIEYRNAKAAEDLYQRLSTHSDAELARLGLDRASLTQHVARQLCRASDAAADALHEKVRLLARPTGSTARVRPTSA
jgi:hypothetical protein